MGATKAWRTLKRPPARRGKLTDQARAALQRTREGVARLAPLEREGKRLWLADKASRGLPWVDPPVKVRW